MSTKLIRQSRLVLSIFLLSASFASSVQAQASKDLLRSYDRLLPLEGGSNFRDMGGYTTADGYQVKRGLLFRSGSMVSLTENDMDYLSQFSFKTVVDLRSQEELELFPNHWAEKAAISYTNVPYSMASMMGGSLARVAEDTMDATEMLSQMGPMYRSMPETIKSQLNLMFQHLLAEEAPLVVNCSAGQDRTGIASALILTALGVPRSTIIDDYLLSTRLRRPEFEQSQISEAELLEAAEVNVFAAMMLQFNDEGIGEQPNPLYTENRVPFLQFALNGIEENYGSVFNYLDSELGIGAEEIERLKGLYLQ